MLMVSSKLQLKITELSPWTGWQENATHLWSRACHSPGFSGTGCSCIVRRVRALSSFIMSSMSKTNGACPKFASTTSPGVWRPTVGYKLGWNRHHQSWDHPTWCPISKIRSKNIAFTYRQICECNTKVVTVFCVKTSVVNKINSATYDVSGCESGSVLLPSAGWTKRMTVVAVVTVRVFVPSWK